MNQEKLASALKYFKDGKWSAAADAFWDIKDQITQPKDIHACAVAFFRDARFSDAQVLIENLISKIPKSQNIQKIFLVLDFRTFGSLKLWDPGIRKNKKNEKPKIS